LLGHRSLIKNKTPTAVINIVSFRRRGGANLVATISQSADNVYFVFARNERVPFSIKTCERLFPVDRCHEGGVGAAFYEDISKRNFLVMFKFNRKLDTVAVTTI